MNLIKYNHDIENKTERRVLQFSKWNWICKYCNKGFMTERYFEIHLKLKHI